MVLISLAVQPALVHDMWSLASPSSPDMSSAVLSLALVPVTFQEEHGTGTCVQADCW